MTHLVTGWPIGLLVALAALHILDAGLRARRGHRVDGVIARASFLGAATWAVCAVLLLCGADDCDPAGVAVRRVNAERARFHRPPLLYDERCEAAARELVWSMAATGKLSQFDSRGRGPTGRLNRAGYRTSGNDLAIDRGAPTAEVVMDRWLHRTEDSQKLLSSRYRHFGLAAVEAEDGTVWWCLVMAAPE
jgi:hypothetical protein